MQFTLNLEPRAPQNTLGSNGGPRISKTQILEEERQAYLENKDKMLNDVKNKFVQQEYVDIYSKLRNDLFLSFPNCDLRIVVKAKEIFVIAAYGNDSGECIYSCKI